MAYRLAELVRNNVVSVLGDWLDSDRTPFALYVDRIRGKGNSLSRSQIFELEGELLADVNPEYLLDQIIDAVGESGTRFELRMVWTNEDGSRSDGTPSKKRFNLIPETPGSRTGSQGSDAATERLSQSLSTGFDTLIARNDESQQRTLDALKGNSSQMERFFETVLTMQSDGANTATIQAIELQKAISETQLAEFKLELVLNEQHSSLGQLMIQALPELLGSSLVSNLATLLGAMATRVNEEAAQIEPAPEPVPAPHPPSGANGAGQDPPAEPAPSAG